MRGLNRTLTVAAAALALCVLGTNDLAAQDGGTLAERNENITITKHNFSISSGRDTTATGGVDLSGIADYGEICVYCHTPHSGNTNGPLWNRTAPAASYTMYNDASNAAQSDLDMTFAGTPNPVSAACLSCHEGTIGLDVIVNKPNASSATANDVDLTALLTGDDALKVLGSDLTNDHPISMVYDPAADDQFKDISSSTLKLFGGGVGTGSVECATCHNPHTANATFLRVANTGSALCLTCHTK